MPLGCSEYRREELPERGWKALRDAATILVDELEMDLENLRAGDAFADTFVMSYLPSKYLLSYDGAFLRRFLVCVIVAGYKLFDPAAEHRLSCLAEELALHTIVRRAEGHLGVMEEEPVDFSYIEDIAFEDADYETLFHPSLDGIEDTPSGKFIRMTNLKFREWFLPFNPDRGDAVHPYADPVSWEKRDLPDGPDW